MKLNDKIQTAVNYRNSFYDKFGEAVEVYRNERIKQGKVLDDDFIVLYYEDWQHKNNFDLDHPQITYVSFDIYGECTILDDVNEGQQVTICNIIGFSELAEMFTNHPYNIIIQE